MRQFEQKPSVDTKVISSPKCWCKKQYFYEDTHREKTPSNKTLAFTKSAYMGIWIVGTSNQLFVKSLLN